MADEVGLGSLSPLLGPRYHERVNDPARTALVTDASFGSGDILERLLVVAKALAVGSLTFGAVPRVRVGERRAR